MPEISRFLGIMIYIRYNEHNPPHFDAEYEKYNAVFLINELKMIKGKLPPRVKSLILEWADLHRDELMIDWNLAQKCEPLNKIKGLV
jgi:Domain of unknown function (DUF4160)